MKLRIELTDRELEIAVYSYLLDIDAITDDMKITEFYPCSKVIELTNHNFKDNSIGDSKQELEDKLEDLEYKTNDGREFAVDAISDISEKIMKIQRKLDELTDEVENTDKELFKTLSDIGDELDKVDEFTLDMESSVRGQ